jgi:hypothetical protein
MAIGDIRWFAQSLLDLGKKVHDLSGDTLKLGFLTSAVTPAIGTSDPHWGGTGTTDLSTNQASPGTSYVTGGPTLTHTWAIVGTVPTLRASKVTLAHDAANTTFSARWAVIYNSTDANKRAIAFIDLGSDRTISGGSLELDWSGVSDDVLTITQS